MRYDTVGCTQILWDFFVYMLVNEIWVIYKINIKIWVFGFSMDLLQI
jgi:hypothetical protein